MEAFNFDKYVTGEAVCPDCGFTWKATVPYGEFFCLQCRYCGGLVGELQEPQLILA